MSIRKKITFLMFAVTLCFLTITMSCVTQTRPFTSKKMTFELLTIHADICPRIPFDMDKSKIVFFSDLHRGMGTTDVFKKNKIMFEKILNHYFELGYTLVYNGDIEEGWGYQRSNIPLILDNHKNQIEIEKKFLKENRYYRIYGNHDDFYRGQNMYLDKTTYTRVYPAVIFEQILENGKRFIIFSTHGCQGHGLHDAGDDVAAWGVSIKYLWLLQFTEKKFKSDKQAIKKMEKVRAEYDKHEKYMLEWAFGDSLKKKCDILIGGHTHRVIFESAFEPKMISIMRKDYEEEAKRIERDKDKPDEMAAESPFKGDEFSQRKTLSSYEQKIIEKLKKMESEPTQPLRIQDKSKRNFTFTPVYFNSGCAFFSEIPCIEISEGKIKLTYIRLGASGELKFDTRKEASLKKYIQ